MRRYQKILKIGICLLFSLAGLTSFSQVYTDTLTSEEAQEIEKLLSQDQEKSAKKVAFQFLPILYYTPETKLALGASGIFTFKFNSEDSLLKVSAITPSFVYTFNNQMLAQVGYDLQINRKWMLNGKLGYYIYPYFFSGIGNAHDGSQKEWYDANYPVISANLYRYVYKNQLSVGLRYRYQNTKITSEPDSLLGGGNVPGSNGSTQSFIGFGVRFDSRDYRFSATKGWYADFTTMWSDKALGSSYQDQFIKTDIRKYISLTSKKDILAMQVYSEIHSGEVPFNLMSMLGGSNLMRGYQQGVYRDRQMLVFQVEYRSRVFLKYLVAAVFGNYGAIGSDFEDIQSNFRYSYGGGIRFTPTPENRYFIRIDYARGENTQGFYVGVGEAF